LQCGELFRDGQHALHSGEPWLLREWNGGDCANGVQHRYVQRDCGGDCVHAVARWLVCRHIRRVCSVLVCTWPLPAERRPICLYSRECEFLRANIGCDGADCLSDGTNISCGRDCMLGRHATGDHKYRAAERSARPALQLWLHRHWHRTHRLVHCIRQLATRAHSERQQWRDIRNPHHSWHVYIHRSGH